MAMFLVRVELHHAGAGDYANLHAAMSAAGFSRRIAAEGGKEFHLPTAEYRITGDYSAARVRDDAKAAADSTGRDSSVLACEFTVAAWVGLPEVL